MEEKKQMRAITISREYGSGGGEIARRLAQRLGWRLIDHELVIRAAQELGISEEEAEIQDEHADSFISSLINSMRILQPAMFTIEPMPLLSNPHLYRETMSKLVETAIEAGPAVIVGRGSQMILAEHRDVFHTRIVATLEKRIRYVMQREQVSESEAKSRIQMKEQDRIRYLQTQYHCHPDDSSLYDLIVNTTVLSLDQCVDLILQALNYKAERLHLPEEELGPGAGLQPYPSLPGDLRPPV
ncbi:cytidylate kinase [Thermosporothrix hazakensis]|jgi:cytidylate kinase|uniref:Cytidylate kinase n=2 Tax=Thermosporothrix TaxID=768650 RepID=A0A326U2G7_THEHA|nr:cytidylate kinase-like family protein [Thermosporothrix hazakensis]PZW25459.1 cytidylate kinase [Thermosporothrix hazakensis]BBH90795.1 hypothetical protein KTC_55460 [Thermosporothrix sp. COM3]GCE48845.1 hypothetical protein KTH_37140 [Thermosporothrix hazakensis]